MEGISHHGNNQKKTQSESGNRTGPEQPQRGRRHLVYTNGVSGELFRGGGNQGEGKKGEAVVWSTMITTREIKRGNTKEGGNDW